MKEISVEYHAIPISDALKLLNGRAVANSPDSAKKGVKNVGESYNRRHVDKVLSLQAFRTIRQNIVRMIYEMW